MDTVRLGRTGQQVSAAGLGCGGHSRLGMAYGKSKEEAAAIVRRALDLGVTYIDTARAYGTEEAVGLGVAGRRDGVFISTKASPYDRNTRTLISAADLTESLDGSLRRLGTEQVDLFNLHGAVTRDYDRCVADLLPELQRQQKAGKTRFIGITELFGNDTDHKMLARAAADAHFDVLMVGFNLLNPSARKSVFPLTIKNDLGVHIMFAVRRALHHSAALRELVGGLIERGEIPRGSVNADDPLDFVAAHPGVKSLTEAAYRFCRHEPGAQVVLTGTGNAAHLEENIAAINAPPLPDDLAQKLRDIFGEVDSVSGN